MIMTGSIRAIAPSQVKRLGGHELYGNRALRHGWPLAAGCELELLLDVCCIVVSLCLSSDGSRCGSFSFVAFVAAIWPMLFCKLLREPSLCFGPCIARM